MGNNSCNELTLHFDMCRSDSPDVEHQPFSFEGPVNPINQCEKKHIKRKHVKCKFQTQPSSVLEVLGQ